MSKASVSARSSGPSRRRVAAVARRTRRRGVVAKISVTVDAVVLDEIKELVRTTGSSLSAHISEALERDLRRRRLQRLIEEYESESGVITEAELAEVRSKWQE